MRDLTAGVLAELTARAKHAALFFEGAFGDGSPPDYVRVWSGARTIEWDGKSWLGVGNLGGVSPITENGDVRATGVAVSLSGIPSGLIATALGEARQGLEGTIWLALLDADGAVIADPEVAFRGRLDVPEITEGGDTATITISYESRLRDLERPRERRYTQEDQNIDYSGDLGFEYVPSIQEWNGKWGVG